MGFASFGFVLFLLCRPDTVADAIANCREAEQICYLFDVHSDCQQTLAQRKQSQASSQVTGGYGVSSEVPRGNLKCC